MILLRLTKLLVLMLLVLVLVLLRLLLVLLVLKLVVAPMPPALAMVVNLPAEKKDHDGKITILLKIPHPKVRVLT